MNKTIAIIPARAGSKSIAFKNIRLFCGKPLLVNSIDVAKNCDLVERVIVTTDSTEIRDIAIAAGAEAPFIRPKEFALDDSLDLPVFIHCLKWLEENEKYIPDIIAHLRPTSPLRTEKMLEDGIKLLINNQDIDSVRSVCPPSQNPYKMWKIDENGLLTSLIKTDIPEQWNQPRQKLPTVYWQNGYVDITRRETILNKNSMTGNKIMPLIVASSDIIDIDNEITFELAEKIYNERNK